MKQNKRDFFQELAKKIDAPVTREMDQRFWKKADTLLAEEQFRQKSSTRDWSIWAGPITIAASFLLIFFVHQTIVPDAQETMGIATVNEILENEEMLENMELLGQMDEVEFSEEEWAILLAGEENG